MVLAILLLLSAGDGSQAAPDPAGLEALLTEAFRLHDVSETAAAETAFERALAMARAEPASPALPQALRGLALIKYTRTDYAAARALLLEALPLFEARADVKGVAQVHSQLGSLAFMTGDRVKAQEFYEQAIRGFDAAGDRLSKANALRNLTFTLKADDPRLADAIAAALAIARQLGDRRLEGLVLHNQGDAFFILGDFARARDTLLEAADRLDEPRSRQRLATVLVSLGRLHRVHGLPEAATAFYRRALILQREAGNRRDAAQTLSALGMSYVALGRPREALAVYRDALDDLRGTDDDLANVVVTNMAAAHLPLRQFDRAVALLEPLLTKTLTPYQQGLVSSVLAAGYLGLGRLEQAIESADRAEHTLELVAEQVPVTLHTRAQARERLGRTAAALVDVETALESIERLRATLVPLDYMKRGFGDRYRELVGSAIRLMHGAGRHRDALAVAERARARAFVDLLATRASHPAATARASGELESSASAAAMSVDELAAAARRLDSTIVSFWVAAQQTVVWALTGDGRLHAASIPVTSDRLASLVRQAASELPNRAGRELHDLLIRPIRSDLPASSGSLLTIIPHGPLFRLSFAALADNRGRYLLEDYRLHYAPAGAILRRADRPPMTPERFTQMKYLFVADPTAPREAAVAALPGAAHEVDAIRRIVPASSAVRLAGSAARESAVRAALPGRDVIHLATHGVLLDDRSADSYLVLGKSGAGAAGDGRLTTDEIYGLDLAADLVVLSACRTARGPVTGDGVVGMTRAFFYAGAASVMASLWDVADESAARVMPAFYRSWPRALDKATALRVAQLDLLDRLRRGQVTVQTSTGPKVLPERPFLWAAFILIGEP